MGSASVGPWRPSWRSTPTPTTSSTCAPGRSALLAAAGHALKIVTATAGECGSAGTDLAETAAIRKAEAARGRGA